MKDHKPYITQLFQKYLDGGYTEQELDQLLDYFGLDEHSAQLKALILQQFENRVPSAAEQEAVKDLVADMRPHVMERIGQPIKIRKSKTWWYAAASVLLIASIATITYISYRDNTQPAVLTSRYGGDVLPGGKRAYVTLSDGRRMELDSSQAAIRSVHGKLRYADGTELMDGAAAEYATVVTPVGGEYEIILPDGSKAWLNASSSLKYPTRFAGEERAVEVAGEVYLEVNPDRQKPFIVRSAGQRIEVLGTAFNVRSYNSNPVTTLVHGKIALTNEHSRERITLVPGQQTTISGTTISVRAVDPLDYIAWKDGFIMNKDASLLQACQELERWYDVRFIFPSGFRNTQRAVISLDRTTMLSAILTSMEATYGVKFTINGKEVRVH